MTLPPSSSPAAVTIAIVVIVAAAVTPLVSSLGSGSTIAVSYGSATVCGIVAGEVQRIQCYRRGQTISILPNISFESISGGRTFFCGLRSGGLSLLCWDTGYTNTSFRAKRIYNSDTVRLTDLTVGDAQVCAVEINTGIAKCWRGGGGNGSSFPSPEVAWKFRTITSGRGFSCGILKNNSRVLCWGNRGIGADIDTQYGNFSMSSLVAGDSHACGLTTAGILICKGNNDFGQLNVPSATAYQYSNLALATNHSCAIRRRNGLVVCWGGGTNNFEFDIDVMGNVSFESIVAGLDFTCGLMTMNLSMICWGPGWSSGLNSRGVLPLAMLVPGPCVRASCSICGIYPNSEALCDGNGNICKSCGIELPVALPLPPIPSPLPPSQPLQPHSPSPAARNRLFWAFAIVGSVGTFAGICTIFYCIWTGVFGFWRKKNNVALQLTNVEANVDTMLAAKNGSNLPSTRSSSIRQQDSWRLRRQRSGTSSDHGDRTEKFSLSELAVATNNFSSENKIGSGGFGIVYKGKLADGREVAIKRGEASTMAKKFQEKESAFEPSISAGELWKVLDMRVGLPEVNEAEAVELVAYTAMRCVNLEGKDRPTMSDIVANLERALFLCEGSHGSISTPTFSFPSE
ncbi:hypothetical protein L1049_013506 [Liquidambar formosana]|uniref:non-specific serine/threonine protein kinase n=1 Tax=Liquidambar formosana TaxID=63359 RepID=A0AAP0RKX6_LIQFO